MSEASAVTQVAYLVRENTTKAHIAGLLQALDAIGAGPATTVRLLTVSDDQGLQLPTTSSWRGPDGLAVPDGRMFTVDNLPAEGLLIVGEPL